MHVGVLASESTAWSAHSRSDDSGLVYFCVFFSSRVIVLQRDIDIAIMSVCLSATFRYNSSEMV